MSYQYERVQPDRGGGCLRGCLIALIVLVFSVLIALVTVRYWLRPQISAWFEDRIARTIDPALPSAMGAQDALRESLEQLPSVPVPSGELRVNEDLANAYLSDYTSRLPQGTQIQVRFVPGEIQATVGLRGLQSALSVRPTVRDGRIVVESAALGQPLGSLISVDGILGALTDRLNADIAAQGKRVTGIDVADGVAVISIE